MKKHPLALAMLAAALAMPTAMAARAQGEGASLEEVVVTARKRSEDLQDVGFSVSALTQSQIDGQFARDITDLANIAPNLVIDDTAQGPGGVAAIFIRGVGVADVEKNFDPAVGVVVDGMFIGSNAGSLLRSIDIASMEVLRGPQGTLFGRNTIGGIINVTRTRPGGAPGGKIRAGYEEYDTYYVDGILNVGVGEHLGIKLSAARRETANIGYIPPDPHGAVINTSTPDQAREAEMLATFDADTHIVEARWQARDDLRLDYVFGYYETDETIISNWDGTPEFLYGTTRPATYEQSTHEFRVNWDNGGAINAVAGAYLWDSEYAIPLRSWVGFVVPGTILDILQRSRQDSASQAVFADIDGRLADKLTLNFGGRYTRDEKSTFQEGNVNASAHGQWSELTPRASLRYQMDENLMTYITYSSGYRSGGFNGRVNSAEEAVQPCNNETVDNFELGFKAQSDDSRLRVNGALFYMVYDDKQEELQLPSDTGTGQKTVVTNAPELRNDDQHLLDASINWEGNAVRLSLFARNLLDEEGYTHGYDVAGLWSYAATRPPRAIGAELVYSLGG